MKKVLLITNSLDIGVAEKILLNIAKAFGKKYEIYIYQTHNKTALEVNEEFNIIQSFSSKIHQGILGKFLSLILNVIQLSRIKKKYQFEFSLSITYRPNILNTISSIFSSSRNTIIYEVTTPSENYKDNPLLFFIYKQTVRKIYPLAKEIICNSHGVHRDLKEKIGINKKINVIYSPLDIELIRTKSKENCQEILKSKSRKFVTVSRIDSNKNIQLMIKSFEKIKDKNSELFIVGDGQEKENIKKLISKLNLKKRVFLLGFKKNPYKYIFNCDFFLFSSKFEGLPSVLIESLVCSTPIISNDCRHGPREILSENIFKEDINNDFSTLDFGILFKYLDEKAFTNAINNCQQVSNSSLDPIKLSRHLRKFSMEGFVKKIEKILSVSEK